MAPDWLDGYIVVSLDGHQVVFQNTKTNKVLKSISVVHIKPYRGREGIGVDAGCVDADIDVDHELTNEIGDGEFGDEAESTDEIETFGGKVTVIGDEIGVRDKVGVEGKAAGVAGKVGGIEVKVRGVEVEVVGIVFYYITLTFML